MNTLSKHISNDLTYYQCHLQNDILSTKNYQYLDNPTIIFLSHFQLHIKCYKKIKPCCFLFGRTFIDKCVH